MNICKELREYLGLSVSELSKSAQMGYATISLVEANAPVSDKTWVKLAEYFKITVEELKGDTPLDVDRWLDLMTSKEPEVTHDEVVPHTIDRPVELHQLGIKHLIRVSSSAANYYLEDGWHLLDTMSENGTFYCLLGNTKFYTSEDFEKLKRKTQSSKSTSYWMSR